MGGGQVETSYNLSWLADTPVAEMMWAKNGTFDIIEELLENLTELVVKNIWKT